MASYVVVPKNLCIKEIENNKLILAPSRYSKFVPENESNFISLKDCVILSNKRKKIKPNKKYYYLEIGDINVNSGYPSYKLEWGHKLPSTNPKELKQDDIVVSTVRTYRKRIGFIDNDKENMVGTSAFLVIRKIKNNMFSKEYLFSILRHDFFIEQILSLQNRGMYPRIDKDNLHLIFVPKPRNKSEHDYITILTKAIINKEKEIRRKHNLILEKIEKELLENQKSNKYEYKFPDITEIEKVGRLDTGLYSEDFKKLDFLIRNYEYGFSLPFKKFNFNSGDTPNKYVISDKGKGTVWISNKDIKYGILLNERYVIFKDDSVKLLAKGDILFSRRAPIGNPMVFLYNFTAFPNEGIKILSTNNYSLKNKIFFSLFLESKFAKNQYLRYGGAIFGGITNDQIKNIKIPNFPESKQKEIAELYYNPIDYPTDLNLNNFLEEDTKWNEKAGILQLDLSAKKLKERLNEVIHQIVMDEEINIGFDFI